VCACVDSFSFLYQTVRSSMNDCNLLHLLLPFFLSINLPLCHHLSFILPLFSSIQNRLEISFSFFPVSLLPQIVNFTMILIIFSLIHLPTIFCFCIYFYLLRRGISAFFLYIVSRVVLKSFLFLECYFH